MQGPQEHVILAHTHTHTQDRKCVCSYLLEPSPEAVIICLILAGSEQLGGISDYGHHGDHRHSPAGNLSVCSRCAPMF